MASSLPEDTTICPEMNPVISALLAKLVFNLPLLPGCAQALPCLLGARGVQGKEETWKTREKQCYGSSMTSGV